jgi:hypothetical protein
MPGSSGFAGLADLGEQLTLGTPRPGLAAAAAAQDKAVLTAITGPAIGPGM